MSEIANAQPDRTDYKSSAAAGLHFDEGQVVVFRLAQEEFGLDINNVKEIVRVPDITPIPRSPEYVAGICNLRGSVLPVIDTRTRFSMEPEASTDHTRLLVVESGGRTTSLRVDSVREVMRMTHALLEPPPAVCRGIDREFLDGIVKVNDGERLILMLNLSEVIAVDLMKQGDQKAARAADFVQEQTAVQADEEKQFVSFKVADEEFAFEIQKVREILKISDITTVPNVPDYVRGVFTIRNHLLPILDMRGLLGLPDLLSERIEKVEEGLAQDFEWAKSLKHCIQGNALFSGTTNAKETPFGRLLERYKTTSVTIEKIIKSLKKDRVKLYDLAQDATEIARMNKQSALTFLEEKSTSILNQLSDTMIRFKKNLEHHITEEQRALVVEAENMTIGFLVDWVDEVIRVPRSVIDETPTLASSERRELKAVAKLDNGERLIMIMDESALVSKETSRILDKARQKAGADITDKTDRARTLAQESMEEEQLVTFTINKQEYGVRIKQVQEINRVSAITTIPRAPAFIDGMTNLRGSVIPVINIRSLFGLENKELDDRARIIIVDTGKGKNGIRVDEVREVLRLSKLDIVPTPAIFTDGDENRFMEGVCRIEDGKRMVVLIDVEKILDEHELKALMDITETAQPYKIKASPAKEQEKKKTDAKSGSETAKKTGTGKTGTGKKLEIAE